MHKLKMLWWKWTDRDRWLLVVMSRDWVNGRLDSDAFRLFLRTR